MSQELCRRLRQDARSSHHGRSAHEAATLIEQQAARIAVLEQQAWCGGTEAKTVRATRDEPLSPACAPCKAPGGTCFPEPCGRYQQRRAEAAEAEVKRLRERFQIGDPVTLRAGYKYGEWVGVPLFIAGMSAAYGSGLIDVALCEKWPPQRNVDRWTDGFSIDDIEKRALATQDPRHD